MILRNEAILKIIYDSDNNFENSENESYGSIESEDVEITFTSDGKPKAVNRPKPNLTPPPKKEEAPAPQQSAQAEESSDDLPF